MNKLEKAILLELKKELITEGNEDDLRHFIIDEFIKAKYDLIFPQKDQNKGGFMKNLATAAMKAANMMESEDATTTTTTPAEQPEAKPAEPTKEDNINKLKNYLNEKMFTFQLLQNALQLVNNRLTEVKETVKKSNRKDLVMSFVAPFGWLDTKAYSGVSDKDPFLFFNRLTDKLDPNVSNYSLAHIYNTAQAESAFYTDENEEGKIIKYIRYQSDPDAERAIKPADAIIIKYLFTIINRIFFNSKPEHLFSLNVWKEASDNDPKKLPKLINKGFSKFGQGLRKDLMTEIKKALKARLVSSYDPNDLGFLLFSKESETWKNLPDGSWNNWVEYFKTWELSEQDHFKLAEDLAKNFKQLNIDPYDENSRPQFVKKTGQTPNPLEILIQFIKNPLLHEQIGYMKEAVVPAIRDAVKIYNKKNYKEDKNIIDEQRMKVYLSDEFQNSYYTVGFELTNYLLTKKEGYVPGFRKSGIDRLELSEALDLKAAGGDPFLEKILEEVYKIGQLKRDTDADKEKSKEEPEEWQRYMRAFQVAYSPAVARFKSTIGDLINTIKKEITVQDSAANRDDLVESDDADQSRVINLKGLQQKQEELTAYQNFIKDAIIPVMQAVTIEEFNKSLNKWNENKSIDNQRADNVLRNETVQNKNLIDFTDPDELKISYDEGKFVPLAYKKVGSNNNNDEPTSIQTADKEIMQKASRTISSLIALQLRVIGQKVDAIKGTPLEKITAGDAIKKMKEDNFDVDENDVKVADEAKKTTSFISDALEYLKQLFGFNKNVWDNVNWEDEQQADLAVKAFIQNEEKTGWSDVKSAILDANLSPENLSKEGKRELVKNLVKSEPKDYIKIDNEYFDDQSNTSIIIEKQSRSTFKKVIKKEIAKRIEKRAQDQEGFYQTYGIQLRKIYQLDFDDFVDNVLNNVQNPPDRITLNLLSKIRNQVQTEKEIRSGDTKTFEEIIALSQKTSHDADKFQSRSRKYFDDAANRDDRLQEKLEKTINNYINKRKQQWRKRTM